MRAAVWSSTMLSEQAPPHSHVAAGGAGGGFGAGGGDGAGFAQCGQPSHLPQNDSRHQAFVGPNRIAEHSGAERLY
jgi:hypothetical protein